MMDEIDRSVLRANHCLIVDTLDLKKSSVLDKLQEKFVISTDEEEQILERGTTRDQNAHLLFLLNRKDESRKAFDSFLSSLSGDYDFLVERLIEAKTSKAYRNSSEERKLCIHCMLVKNLNPSDVSHQLFEEGIISDYDLREMNNKFVARRERVGTLLHALKNHENKGQAMTVLTHTLKRKYEYLTNISTPQSLIAYTSCRCVKRTNPGPCEQTDEATDLNIGDGNTKDDQIQVSQQASCQLCRKISKSSPDNKRLMRLCSKGFHTLFLLRESGNWDQYNKTIANAFKSFRKNPDVQLILLRCEMTVHTLYKEDTDKANDLFENAMALLPQSTMPNWHIVTFLAQKIELCIRTKRLEEARKVLELAHQTAATLSPCMGTAAVYLFEALYLAEILRCTKGGQKSESIRERVKTSFLTACKHYNEDMFFNVKSFSNQVYLHLALFALGVDFKKINYIGIQNVHVRESEIALAEHYLNMFENECWEGSTNWSRMLFFVARAEQHKLRSNLRRCLDYLKEAEVCAIVGKFVEQQKSIGRYVDFVQEKYNEHVFIKEAQLRADEDEFLRALQDSDWCISSDE